MRTLLGPKKEKEINWYLQIGLREKLLGQLKPHLGKIAQIILCCSTSVSNFYQSLVFFNYLRMLTSGFRVLIGSFGEYFHLSLIFNLSGIVL